MYIVGRYTYVNMQDLLLPRSDHVQLAVSSVHHYLKDGFTHIAMSGFEVAGAVLGAIPLVISALEHYQQGVRVIQRWRKYDKELQSLIRNIETERVKLQNVCEKLLDGLVPPSQIDTMVENPGGDLWMDEEIQAKIRVRLWRSWAVFEQILRDIQAAITDISERVGNGRDVSHSDSI